MIVCRTGTKKRVVAGVAVLALTVASPLMAAAFDRGEELYDNHCRECHEQGVHLRKNRKVTTVEELRRRVVGWSVHSGLDWSAEDIDDVTDYLGQTYYRLIEGS